jgi:hypothetical protein
MAKGSNIVHQYFKKQIDDLTVLVRLNPIHFKITEITINQKGETHLREIDADQEVEEDLKADGFESASPLEFNLYFSGLAGS